MPDTTDPAAPVAGGTATALASSPLPGFPALAHLLGPDCFARLADAAAARAAELGCEPGAVVHHLLLQRDAPRPSAVSSRLAADVAALERAIEEVARRAPDSAREQRLRESDLVTLPLVQWERAALVTLRAFRLIPVAYRLESWVRRLHSGASRPPPPPRREEQAVAVYALPGMGALRPDAWWQGLSAGEGRLLATVALGAPLGEAARDAVTRGAVANPAAARALITAWVREGMFASVHVGD
jgi:hypothetical protein